MAVRAQAVAALLAVSAASGCAQVSEVAQSPQSASISPAASVRAPATIAPRPTPSASSPSPDSPPSAGPSAASTSAAAQAIPWLDQPVAKIIPPDLDGPVTHPVLYRPCAGPADLTVRPNGWGAAMGTMAEFIYLTNISTTPCTLAGTVAAVIGVDGPHEHSFPLAPGGIGQGPDPVADLKPGQTGWMQLTQREDCASDPERPWLPESPPRAARWGHRRNGHQARHGPPGRLPARHHPVRHDPRHAARADLPDRLDEGIHHRPEPPYGRARRSTTP